MIQRSTLIGSAFVAAAVLGSAFVPACSSSKSTATTTDSGTPDTNTGTDSSPGTDASAPPYTRQAPPPRPTTMTTGTTTTWYAVNGLALGLSPRGSTTSSSTAWENYGFDIDGFDTLQADSRANANTACNKISGAPSTVLTDGTGGTDNNFGSQIMPVIKELNGTVESTINTDITTGKFSLLLRIDNAPTSGDATGVVGTVYVAGNLGATPTFTTSDVWPVAQSSLVNTASVGGVSNAVLTFPNGYVSGGYWVSGDFGSSATINLQLALGGATITLPIESGVITVKLADGTDGTIAGAVDTGALQTSLTPVAEQFGICPGNSTYTQVVNTLTQSADVVSGAPNLSSPGTTCNAISIAIGFTMLPTGTPTVVAPPSVATPNSCSDAGVADTGTGETADGG